MDANEKMLRNRFARWKAGYHSQVWRDVVAAYSKQAHRNTRRSTEETSELPPSTLRRVKSLIEGGQLSRACQRLSSRGIAALTPQNTMKIAALFPPAAPIAKESVLHPEGTPWNIEPTDVIKSNRARTRWARSRAVRTTCRNPERRCPPPRPAFGRRVYSRFGVAFQ